jgi:hypothetical protein
MLALVPCRRAMENPCARHDREPLRLVMVELPIPCELRRAPQVRASFGRNEDRFHSFITKTFCPAQTPSNDSVVPFPGRPTFEQTTVGQPLMKRMQNHALAGGKSEFTPQMKGDIVVKIHCSGPPLTRDWNLHKATCDASYPDLDRHRLHPRALHLVIYCPFPLEGTSRQNTAMKSEGRGILGGGLTPLVAASRHYPLADRQPSLPLGTTPCRCYPLTLAGAWGTWRSGTPLAHRAAACRY